MVVHMDIMYGPTSAAELRTTLLDMVRVGVDAVRSGSDEIVRMKAHNDGAPGDFATVSDDAAQRAAEEIRAVRMPWAGAIGEEESLRVACTLPGVSELFAYFTFDMLDGTHRYKTYGLTRGGVGSMVAFVWDGKVVAAAVGNVRTGTVFLLDPTDGHVYQVEEAGFFAPVDLSVRERNQPLASGTTVMRGDLSNYHPLVAKLHAKEGPLLPGADRLELPSGFSFGLGMSGLWTGRYVLHTQGGRPGHYTPWDDTPVIGLNFALDMVYLRISEDGLALEQFVPELVTGDPVLRPESMLVLHRLRIHELHRLIPVKMMNAA